MSGDNYTHDLPIIEPDEWEVEYSSLAFGKQIGEGAFGTVSKATVTGLPGCPPQKEVVVAVKKLKGETPKKCSFVASCEFGLLLCRSLWN